MMAASFRETIKERSTLADVKYTMRTKKTDGKNTKIPKVIKCSFQIQNCTCNEINFSPYSFYKIMDVSCDSFQDVPDF